MDDMPLPHADHPAVHSASLDFEVALAGCTSGADPLVARARRWSSLAHAGQVRPDGSGTPYAAHPLRVAMRVARWWPEAPAAVLAAALLHDTLEDQPEHLCALAADEGIPAGTPEEALLHAFGPAVLELVQALTSPPWEGTPEQKNAAYRDRVVHTIVTDPRAGIVKLADFHDNGLALAAVTDPQKRAKLSAKYRPVVEALIEALGGLAPAHPLAPTRTERVAELRAALEAWPA